jgi:hypothetical protein
VVNRRGDAEAGKMRLGCVFMILVTVVGFYFGIQYGEVRWRWYQIQDTVNEQASFAPALDDATMRSRLMVESDRLGLPYGQRDWTITRRRDPRTTVRTITIAAPPYEDSVVLQLPGLRKVWKFTFQPGTSEAY